MENTPLRQAQRFGTGMGESTEEMALLSFAHVELLSIGCTESK